MGGVGLGLGGALCASGAPRARALCLPPRDPHLPALHSLTPSFHTAPLRSGTCSGCWQRSETR